MKTRLLLLARYRLVITFLCLLTSVAAYAQTPGFWGMTSEGGIDEVGAIFKTAPDGTGLTVKHSFNVLNAGARPYVNAQLLQLPNGKLYGVTSDGGNNNVGVLFEYDPTTGVYSKKFDFSNTLGRAPMGMLALASNGKLYGIATAGGTNNFGTIYEYDPATNVATKKIDLTLANGHSPYGNSLYFNTNGKFYGMTLYGGASNFGVLFEYDPSTNIYTKKIDFTGSANGAYPYGSLMVTSAGKIFGMTSQGGANNKGTIFEYSPTTNTLTKRFDFTTASGSQPFSSLIEAGNNRLYGVAPLGGSLFEFNPATNTFAKKIDINTTSEGSFPYATLAKDNNGKLYGVAVVGGANNEGVIFEYDISTNTYTKKYDFAAATGSLAYGGLTLANNGNFYGMTYQGGLTGGQGVIFEYNPTTATYTKKIDFEQTPNGSYPFGGLVQATNKKFYGLTITGGETNAGVLFELDPATGQFTRKHDFARENGAFPQGTLAIAPSGKLYGMTSRGGSVNDDGVIFEFDPSTSAYTVKYEFDDINGSEPFGNLTLASNNKFYGTTSEGGVSGYGVLFEYDPATNTFTKKTEFDNTTVGFNPYDALIEIGNGKFYGTCRDGGLSGNGLGTLFEYDLATNTISKKFNFIGSVGESPESGLVRAANGKLYGTTRYGGSNGNGVLFEYDAASDTYTKKFDFGASPSSPSGPVAGLALSSNGKLYGSTLYGGTNNRGVLFEYDPATNSLVTKENFTGPNGAGLLYGRLLFVKGEQTLAFAALLDKTIGDAGFTLSATSSVGLPVSFSTTSTKITLAGNQVTLTSPGRVTIAAIQAGDANYNAASVVEQTFCIKPAKPSITVLNDNTESPTLTSSATSGNQWFLNGSAIAGATNGTYNVTQQGIYNVQISVDGCLSALSNDAPIIVTAIEALSNQIKLYPNPASTDLVVTLGGFKTSKDVAVRIVDLLGRELYQAQTPGGTEMRIDIRSFPSGQFILKLGQGRNQISKSFLKTF